jgi:hypothetical protein
VADAVMRALAKKQDDRFADVAGFVEAFTGRPMSAAQRPASASVPPPKSSSAAATADTLDSSRLPNPMPMLPTMATADTVASVDRKITVPERKLPPASSGKTARRMPWLLVAAGLTIGVSGMVVLLVFFKTQPSTVRPPANPVIIPDAAVVKPPVDKAPTPETPTADAAPAVIADAAPPVIDSPPAVDTPPDKPPEKQPLSAQARAALDRGTQALARGELDAAMVEVRKALKDPAAEQEAELLRGKVGCKQQDLTVINGAKRQLNQKNLSALKRFCAQVNFPLR